jgi:hypothetical protein
VGRKKRRRQIRIEEEQREKKEEWISPGPLCNFKKLQGLVCKIKFSIDLKPK